MGVRLFSTKNRPPHLGPYPLERLKRVSDAQDLSQVPVTAPLNFNQLDTPHSLVNAMGDYQAMMDVIRAGVANPELATAPTDIHERANHMKSFGYFQDASMMGICKIPNEAFQTNRYAILILTDWPMTFAPNKRKRLPRVSMKLWRV